MQKANEPPDSRKLASDWANRHEFDPWIMLEFRGRTTGSGSLGVCLHSERTGRGTILWVFTNGRGKADTPVKGARSSGGTSRASGISMRF
jgi:hypothetical protein